MPSRKVSPWERRAILLYTSISTAPSTSGPDPNHEHAIVLWLRTDLKRRIRTRPSRRNIAGLAAANQLNAGARGGCRRRDPFATVIHAMKQMTRLSSQLFLLLHDPFTGKGEVGQELLECGVSAAQLADLVIARRLRVIDDQVVMAGPVQAGSADEVGEYVLGCVADQSTTYSVRMWVASLGGAVTDLVVRELVDAGVVLHERGRRGLRGRKLDRFPARDLLRASNPRNRVRHMLAHPTEFDLAGATIASIVGALGAERVFEARDTRELLRELNAHMPLPLQAVMTGLAAAVASVSVTLGAR